MTVAERFYKLFRGHDHRHGHFTPSGKDEHGKVTGVIGTTDGAVTVELWEAHLSGVKGLGIAPLTASGHLYFGAVDIDVYGQGHAEKLAAISRSRLPLFPAVSKSGGLHVYMFFNKVEGERGAALLRHIALWLGCKEDVEIFPKQTKASSMAGNWINLPYWAGRERTMLDAATSRPLTIDEFLNRAGASVLEPARADELYHLMGGHMRCSGPALAAMGPGNRNNTLFVMRRYWTAAGLSPDQADQNQTTLLDYVVGCGADGLTKPSDGKADRPCHIGTCRRNCYASTGIGRLAFAELELRLTKYGIGPDPTYFLCCEGYPALPLTMETFMNPQVLRTELIKAWDVIPLMPTKGAQFEDLAAGIVASQERISLPPETTPEGQFLCHTREFLVTSSQLLNEDTSSHAPWCDDKFHYYTLDSLFNYADARRYRGLDRAGAAAALLRAGHVEVDATVAGRPLRAWKVGHLPGFTMPQPDNGEGELL